MTNTKYNAYVKMDARRATILRECRKQKKNVRHTQINIISYIYVET